MSSMNYVGARVLTARIVSFCLAVGCTSCLIAVVGPYRLGLASYERLQPFEQLSIYGGQVPIRTNLCVNDGLNTTCDRDDTDCSPGNANCAEMQIEGALCADELQYLNPTRCSIKPTTLCCVDNDPNQVQIICYRIFYCFCTRAGSTWSCSTGEEQAPNKVAQCYTQPCPGT